MSADTSRLRPLLLPATDIRERERLAAVVGIFYADFAVTDEHPGLGPPFCITFSVWLPAADFIMQVMPDIRFPVTDSDYLFLYLPQPFGHALRSLLPAVTFFFFTGTFFSLVLNTVGVRGTTPAPLFDKIDWQGAVGGVHQDRVSQQPVRLRVSGGIPQVIKCRTVTEVNGGGIFQREEQRMCLTCPCSGSKSGFGNGLRGHRRVTYQAVRTFNLSSEVG